MKKVTLADAPKVPFNLEGFIMHTSPSLEVIHLCLKPGQEIAQHSNPFDVVACVIEGEVVLTMDENHTHLSKFDVAEVEKNLNRGFQNHGVLDVRLLILKKL